MAEPSENRFDHIKNAVRKKRTPTSRRPRPESQPYRENNERSPLSSTPSDDTGKVSGEDVPYFHVNPKRKEFSLSQCMSRALSISEPEREKTGRTPNNRRSTEGVLAPANWKSTNRVVGAMEVSMEDSSFRNGRHSESQHLGNSGTALDGLRNESKVRKVKLKLRGVTHTLHTNSTGIGGVQPLDDSRSQTKHNGQSSTQDGVPYQDRTGGLRGIPWKDFSSAGFSFGREDPVMRKGSRKNSSGKQADQAAPVRKSKRVPKRRPIDVGFDEDDDDEIRYLEKLKNKIAAGNNNDDEESGRKQRPISRVMENLGSANSAKDVKKKSKADGVSEDTDYEEEEDVVSDDEPESQKKRKQKKESVESLMENRREMTLTTRQRALQSNREASGPVSSAIEFPNGLPPAPSRKQKEKLSEVEQQLKKAEAALRRKMQNEKAARESEAEAIRKILGQDSNRKKREERMKKQQEELAQEKAAREEVLAKTCVRTVVGPTGTTVSFPNEVGLPSIFTSKPVSYPPPREKCAGPNCANPYKYRDSKTNLPLCSLQCYKAVQKQPPETEKSF